MKAIGNKIGVIFDETHLKKYDLGNGFKIERAESWRGKEGDENSVTKTQSNVNHLETNPQIGWVAMANDNYDLKEGDKIFMHYLAYEEFEEKLEIEGKEIYLIDEGFIFFAMKEDYEMRPNLYLGQIVSEEAPITASGIYLTPVTEIKNNLKIKITHIPKQTENEYGIVIKPICNIGDNIIPIDESNYPIKVDGKEYVMLKDTEIIALWQEHQNQD